MIQANQAEAERMARVGYEAVIRRYNWESEAKKLASLYDDILG